MLHETEVLYLDRMGSAVAVAPRSQTRFACARRIAARAANCCWPCCRANSARRSCAALKLERFTQNTITDPELLEAETRPEPRTSALRSITRSFLAGIVCVAAPIIDENGALHRGDRRACAGFRVRPLSRAPLEFRCPRLQEAARETRRHFSDRRAPITGASVTGRGASACARVRPAGVRRASILSSLIAEKPIRKQCFCSSPSMKNTAAQFRSECRAVRRRRQDARHRASADLPPSTKAPPVIGM